MRSETVIELPDGTGFGGDEFGGKEFGGENFGDDGSGDGDVMKSFAVPDRLRSVEAT